MKEIILVKCGEMVLKGLNKSSFTAVLLKNIKKRLKPLGKFSITSAQSTIYIDPVEEECPIAAVVDELKKIFGIASICVGAKCEKNIDNIEEIAASYLKEELQNHKTFKVEAKRSDKKFPLNSLEIMSEVGGYLLEQFPDLQVDVHRPELTVYVEIRDFSAYVHAKKIPGAGGMPLGTGGKATLLLSGGLDSPVAGYMIAKRGVELNAVHFFSHPYTSEQAKEKVISLAGLMCDYCDQIKLHIVSFTDIQLAIRKECQQEYFTIIMRRFMMRIASEIARQTGSLAVVTGESIGQVASQTLHALHATDAAANLPVFRPCIGMDKSEIVSISRKIGTYDTSVLPYEDCCTIFTPKHPKLHPELAWVEKQEQKLDGDRLVKEAMASIEIHSIVKEGSNIL